MKFRLLRVSVTPSRSKLGYTLAIKCSSVELDLSSLNQNIGDLRIAIQNGSSGNVMTQTTEYYNGTEWVFAQTTEYPGNGDILDFPENIVSKGNVERVRFTFDRASWFYGLTASTNDTADGNPEFLNVNPESGANLSYSGELNVRFDEIVKAGSNNITLGNATITSADYRGNMLVVNYDGLTSNPVLNIPSSSILDLNGNSIDSDINIVYKLDNTAPVFESVSPINGSEIHVNDLGETSRKINVKFNEDIVLGEGEITFGKASLTTVVEGNTLIIGYEGLDYNSQNTLLIPASAIKDLSDNYIENDLSFTFTTGSRDAQSPVLISTSINNGDVMPIAGSISITFDEIINIASQKASVNGENVYLSNNLSVVGVNYNSLNYGGEEYVLNIPAGCITDTCGNEFPAFEISFVTENKNPQAFSIIVDKPTLQHRCFFLIIMRWEN